MLRVDIILIWKKNPFSGRTMPPYKTSLTCTSMILDRYNEIIGGCPVSTFEGGVEIQGWRRGKVSQSTERV